MMLALDDLQLMCGVNRCWLHRGRPLELHSAVRDLRIDEDVEFEEP
jgi:hypothetical protein